MINYNENEAENEKMDHIIDTTKIELGQNMDTNILNVNVSQHYDNYVQ